MTFLQFIDKHRHCTLEDRCLEWKREYRSLPKVVKSRNYLNEALEMAGRTSDMNNLILNHDNLCYQYKALIQLYNRNKTDLQNAHATMYSNHLNFPTQEQFLSRCARAENIDMYYPTLFQRARNAANWNDYAIWMAACFIVALILFLIFVGVSPFPTPVIVVCCILTIISLFGFQIAMNTSMIINAHKNKIIDYVYVLHTVKNFKWLLPENRV